MRAKDMQVNGNVIACNMPMIMAIIMLMACMVDASGMQTKSRSTNRKRNQRIFSQGQLFGVSFSKIEKTFLLSSFIESRRWPNQNGQHPPNAASHSIQKSQSMEWVMWAMRCCNIVSNCHERLSVCKRRPRRRRPRHIALEIIRPI